MVGKIILIWLMFWYLSSTLYKSKLPKGTQNTYVLPFLSENSKGNHMHFNIKDREHMNTKIFSYAIQTFYFSPGLPRNLTNHVDKYLKASIVALQLNHEKSEGGPFYLWVQLYLIKTIDSSVQNPKLYAKWYGNRKMRLSSYIDSVY